MFFLNNEILSKAETKDNKKESASILHYITSPVPSLSLSLIVSHLTLSLSLSLFSRTPQFTHL